MANNKVYSLVENENSVDIFIYGIIGSDDYWNDGTNNAAFPLVSSIKELEKKYKTINIHINSPGGIIDDGLAIYNTIKNSPAQINTYNDGITASMASIIMLAGHKKHFNKTSVFHLHSPWSMTIGNIQDHEESIKLLNTYQEILIQAVKDNSPFTEEEIKALFFDGKDHFMTATEAKEYGFVDEIIDGTIKIKLEEPSNLNYKDIYNSFQKKTLGQKIQNLFKPLNNNPNTNQKKQIIMNKSFKGLMAFLFVDALSEDENGKLILDNAQAAKIENELSRLQAVENSLIEAKANIVNLEKQLQDQTAEKEMFNSTLAEKDKAITELTASITAKDETIANLNETIKKAPAANSTSTKTNLPQNSDGVNWDLINSLPHNQEADDYFNVK